MTAGARPPAAGDPEIAARLAKGELEDVPIDVLQAGLRLPLHDYLGLELVGLRPVTVEAPLTDHTRSFTGPLHGGVVATLADVAAGIAAATSGAVDVTRYGLVTTRLEVDYHAQPKDGPVRATAEVTGIERRGVHVECAVTDGERRTIARAAATVRMLPGGVALPGLDARAVRE